jgi:hypothetical protein
VYQSFGRFFEPNDIIESKGLSIGMSVHMRFPPACKLLFETANPFLSGTYRCSASFTGSDVGSCVPGYIKENGMLLRMCSLFRFSFYIGIPRLDSRIMQSMALSLVLDKFSLHQLLRIPPYKIEERR